ncbi:MAG: DEAD/DEAH box helicase [Oscillospiraceae bacterium]|nr:DEAD/DEAH box helicase [Oscillospiraceae bacterium]
MKFEELNIIRPILNALAEQGYESPTPIQEQALPPALAGRDVLGCAQTGTGKTCAFAVPILQRLNARPNKEHPIRALVLTPTRELAIQIQECFEAYGKHLPLRSTVIFGGVGQNPQVEALHRGTDILVATPGRLQDLHDQGQVNVEQLEVLVLDEADRMLDMGFIHDVKRILAWLPKRKQTLFFSATMPGELTSLVNSLLHNPVKVAVDPVSSPVERIEQRLYFVDKNNKTKLLADLLEQEQATSALVFTRTKYGANKVAGDLKKRGVNAEAIHGNKSQTARQNALNGFKEGTVRVLVATDIAARGLDIEELPYVFNYNLPDVPETYVHRIGRTGRAGREGIAISFCDISEMDMLKGIERLIGRKVPVIEGHPYPMVVLEAPKKDKHGRPVNPDDQEARMAARQKRQERTAVPAAESTGKEVQPVAEDQKQSAAGGAAKGKKKQKKTSRSNQPRQKAVEPESAAKYEVAEQDEDSLPTVLRPVKRERTYTRPVRQTSLKDFLKEISGDEDEADYSDFPLLEQQLREERGGDRFLDATDRMFATHSSRYRDAYGDKRRGASNQSGSGKKKQNPQNQGKSAGEKPAGGQKSQQPQKKAPKDGKRRQPAQTAKPQPVEQEQQAAAPVARPAKKKTGGKKKSAAKPGAPGNQPPEGRLLNVKPRKNRTYRTPPPMERSHYATQKDSTEQKSLMKPYYINKKDS